VFNFQREASSRASISYPVAVIRDSGWPVLEIVSSKHDLFGDLRFGLVRERVERSSKRDLEVSKKVLRAVMSSLNKHFHLLEDLV
jgi:hypothetical protein